MNTYNLPNIITPLTVMNATINSSACQLENMIGYSIQIAFTGTPTGSFKLQGSSDPVPKSNLVIGANGVITYTPTNWTDITNTNMSVSAAGNVMWNIADVYYNYVRAVYTDSSSGSSTAIIASAIFNGKGV